MKWNRGRGVAVVLAASLGLSMVSVMALAAVNATPEVDRANATLQLNSHKFKSPAQCVGEDGGGYETLRGKWSGGEVDFVPGSTDYNLTGPLSLSKVVWTINLGTGRGVLRSPITLLDPATGSTTYRGKITLVTQGIPGNVVVQGKGLIDANTFDPPGTADGGSLLANIEVQIQMNLDLQGEFGDVTPQLGFLDFSATTINRTCP